MHTNYINQIYVTKDSKRVFTCGRDRRIKAWDWIKLECLATLLLHEDSVESMVFNNEETILFSGSHDKTVNVWSTINYCHLLTLNSDSPIRTLTLSSDNDMLMYQTPVDEKGIKSLGFWVLESNKNAFIIGVPLNDISNCYVTPNNEFLVTMNGNT